MKANFRTIRTQVSQPASAGNVADMSELQAQNCMIPKQWTRLLRSVVCHIWKYCKTAIARKKSIKTYLKIL